MSALTSYRRDHLGRKIAVARRAIDRLEEAYDQDIVDEQIALLWLSLAAASLAETATRYERWLTSQRKAGAM